MPAAMCPASPSVRAKVHNIDLQRSQSHADRPDHMQDSLLNKTRSDDNTSLQSDINRLNQVVDTSTSLSAKERENWVYIAVPFLVVVAVVAVGVLTTCLFLRIMGTSNGVTGVFGNSNRSEFTCKNTSSRYKATRPSLSDWEMSPLNRQQVPSLEVNESYVDWLQSIQAHVRVFPANDFTVIKELGEGAFGRVFLAQVTHNETTSSSSECQQTSFVYDNDMYAMKLLKNVTNEKLEDLEREAAVMSQLNHPNIVKFFGLSFKSGSLALIFEYMQYGDLVNYLRNHSPEVSECERPLCVNDLLAMAIQVAKGLEYLAERHLVHRDLAARNCLVGKDMTVKISDFGMTRDIYITDYYKMGNHTLVPLRWLPPESILYRKFTVESDVWSFGVLLWEIFSYGKIPWYMYSNSEVLQVIQEGRLLSQDDCPKDIYEKVILKCWTKHPAERLKIGVARETLEQLLKWQYCIVMPSASDAAIGSFAVPTSDISFHSLK